MLQLANIRSVNDIRRLFKLTIAEFMEDSQETELDGELSYSKYGYKNIDMDNNSNGQSTNFGDVEVSAPRDWKGALSIRFSKRIKPVSAAILRRGFPPCVPRV